MATEASSIAGKSLADLLSDFPVLEKMPGASLQAQFIQFRILALSAFQSADSTDTFGVVGAFLTPAEFTTYQEPPVGEAAEAYEGHAHPGDIPDAATAADLYIHSAALRAHLNEKAIITALQNRLHAALPEHMRNAFISTSGVTRLGKPRDQWAKIQSLVGPLAAEHLAAEHAALLLPYRVGTPLREFFDTHDKGHRFRAMVGFAYTSYEKNELAVHALSACGLFTISLRRFFEQNPTLPAQTYEALKTLMLIEGERDISAHKTTLSTVHAVTTLTQEVSQLKAQVATLTAAARDNRSAPNPSEVRHHFCWTCGPQTGHPSHLCTRPAAGHQRGATRRDRMGSSA